MSIYQQYYDISSDDNDDDSLASSCSSQGHVAPRNSGVNRNNNSNIYQRSTNNDNHNSSQLHNDDDELWGRSILHIDVDCFYVQCEELDRGLRAQNEQETNSSIIPLAIGQKHIVVTCNYAARARGVTKLMSKTKAVEICPDLWIVDGSDLRNYRTHSKLVYEAFRRAVQEEISSCCGVGNEQKEAPNNALPCQRNAMDEMMADLSTAVNKLLKDSDRESKLLRLESLLSENFSKNRGGAKRSQLFQTYVFGDDPVASSLVRIVEDQSGAHSTLQSSGKNNTNHRSLAPTRRNVHEDQHQRRKGVCQTRLEIAVRLAHFICQSIFFQTRFHVSAGVSVSPLLAKLAVIEKPKTVNLLLPWRSSQILYQMPLRKLNEIGSRTYRALSKVVRRNHHTQSAGDIEAPPIVVHDLLQTPRHSIIEALQTMASISAAAADNDRAVCEQKCNLILERCRGLDRTLVKDDGGGVPKTVSVENSYKRGTVTTPKSVRDALKELCRRLPPLVRDRASWSKNPSLAYPTTIRLTVRVVVQKQNSNNSSLEKQRINDANRHRKNAHHVTRSKQMSIGMQRGKILLVAASSDANNSAPAKTKDAEAKDVVALHDFASLLLPHLVPPNERTIVTRMNLGATNFRDALLVKDSTTAFQSPHLNRIQSQRTPTSMIQWTRSPAETHNSNTPQSQARMKSNGNSQTQNSKEESPLKRKASPPSVVQGSSQNTRKLGSFHERPTATPRKFSRTRIDHFFAKKQS